MEDRLDYLDWNITISALQDNGEPMSWNLFLALIPLALSCILFNQPQSAILRWSVWILLAITAAGSYPRFAPCVDFLFDHSLWVGLGGGIALGLGLFACFWKDGRQGLQSLIWWVGLMIFVLFLPNAAYVLTDLIHLIFDIRKDYPISTVLFFLIPQYFLFIATGFEAYVLSICNLEAALLRQPIRIPTFWIEGLFHSLSAIGIYLGRFTRFNSWDVLTNFERLIDTIQSIFLSSHALISIAILFLILTATYRLFKCVTLELIQRSNPDLKDGN